MSTYICDNHEFFHSVHDTEMSSTDDTTLDDTVNVLRRRINTLEERISSMQKDADIPTATPS